MKRFFYTLILAATLGAALTASAQAPRVQAGRVQTAEHRAAAPAQDIAALRERYFNQVRANPQIRSYERHLPNGITRMYTNVSGREGIARMEAILDPKSNVLEILHFDAPNLNHTLALFRRNLVHTQYAEGTGHWRLREWGDRLRPSQHTMYSAQIQLTEAEANRLQERLNAAQAEQGPEHAAGPNWENGHIRVGLGERCSGINCVSTWSEMPIGEHGEPLWRVLGLRASYTANPRGLQRALEREGNERVIGITVYGPQVQNFGQNPDRDVVNF